MALIFIMIYVGAIAVLFLFVVMMLNIKRAKTSDKSKYLSFGSILFLIFTIQIYLMVQNNYIQLVDSSTNNTEIIQWFTKIDTVSNINTIGQILYTSYFIYFLIAGIILLIGMISSITLSMQDLSGVRRQHVFQQISRNLETAIFITSRKKDYNLDRNK
jgi:NADH:ubiquinone oxidoreductase subunit 6 (subunit J)